MKNTQTEIRGYAIDPKQCGFCYPREHGKNGEVKREFSDQWGQMISVCRKHSFEGKPLVKEGYDTL